jgi:branched-chain amino acid transport system substrate-binding protein
MLNKRRLQVADQLKKIACTALAGASVLGYASCAGAETLKIAFIETLSGTFAPIGQNQLNTYRMFADIANKEKKAGAGNIIEVVGFDGKGSPQESLTQLKVAADQGFRYIAQGNGSGVALALIEAVNKHNERNPGKEIVFLNHSAIDPTLTNSKCSFWHFRFDANTDMRMQALTDVIRGDSRASKVYLIGQDYSFGHAVAREARRQLAAQRPDVQIVGEELHAMGRVKDFLPYAAKIKASGAQAVITGNFGNDLTLLVKAAREVGFEGKFYTFYGNALGAPAAIGDAGVGKVIAVADWLPNVATAQSEAFYQSFRQRFPKPADDYVHMRMQLMVESLAQAIEKAGSLNAFDVASQLEKAAVSFQGQAGAMRASDHQFQQPLVVGLMERQGAPGVKFDVEGSGYGFRVIKSITAARAEQPTSCKMVRPQS